MAISEKNIETLVNAVRKVSSSLDLDEVLGTIFDSLQELMDYSAAVVGLVDSETGVVHSVKARGYPPDENLEQALEQGHGIISWVIQNGRGQIVNDVKTDTRYVKARAETLSEISAPIIRADGAVIGAINLESDRINGYNERDLELLTMFASLAASAINSTLLYQQVMRQREVESELVLARKVVESLLPRSFPQVPGFDLYGMTIPMHVVGGDYFDFMDSMTDRLAVIVADVSGKGLAAALIMVTFRAYMRATIANELAMRAVMARVNRLLHEGWDGDRFITTFYGLIDPEHRRLLYISAGHNPPLLLRADGTSLLLEHSGFPLGVFPDSRYSESVINFRSGDVLVMYTDGVTEARNAFDDGFGTERLEKIVRQVAHLRASDICQAVTEAVNDFSSEVGGPEDDLTISVIKVE